MKLKLICLLLCLPVLLKAQTKLGDNPTVINAGSLLELESLSKGLRLPRIQLDNVKTWGLDGTAANGMLIFNASGAAPKGMYYWDTDSVKWCRLATATEFASIVKGTTSVLNTAGNNKLITTVNGISALPVNLISTNHLHVSADGNKVWSSINGINSDTISLFKVSNGLSISKDTILLGGDLTHPTIIATSASNTFAITGLQSGTISDNMVVIDPASGVLKSAPYASFSSRIIVTYTATSGQTSFSTPATIFSLNNIIVLRNGIDVKYTATIGSNTVTIDFNNYDNGYLSSCLAGDEIKIIQWN